MAIVLSPITALNDLLKMDPKVAKPLFAGIAVFAAVAVVGTFGVDRRTVGLMAIEIVGLGAVLMVLANVLNDKLLKKVLGWFVTLLIMALVTAFFVSAVFRHQGIIKPVYCLSQIWKVCEDAEREVVSRNSEVIQQNVRVAPAAAATAKGVDPAAHIVSIRFAGLITRNNITGLNHALREGGWGLDGDSGERAERAQGLNQVRYSDPADRPAAEALAHMVSETAIASAAVEAKASPGVPPGVLELWISH
jgi:hypothetical protein